MRACDVDECMLLKDITAESNPDSDAEKIEDWTSDMTDSDIANTYVEIFNKDEEDKDRASTAYLEVDPADYSTIKLRIGVGLLETSPYAWRIYVYKNTNMIELTEYIDPPDLVSGDVGNWVEVILPWTVFERAHWADEGGPTEFDPTRVTGLGINFWADNDPNEGTLWIDDISLATGEMAPPEEEEEEEPTAEPVEPTEETAEEPVEPTEPVASAVAVEPTQAAEPTAAPVEEESSGGLCPFSMIMLPLMLVTVVLSRKFTKDLYKE